MRLESTFRLSSVTRWHKCATSNRLSVLLRLCLRCCLEVSRFDDRQLRHIDVTARRCCDLGRRQRGDLLFEIRVPRQSAVQEAERRETPSQLGILRAAELAGLKIT